MNLSGNKSRVTGLAKDIAGRWSSTREHWRDQRGAEFEQRFMAELAPRVAVAVTAIDKLDELFKRIRKECE